VRGANLCDQEIDHSFERIQAEGLPDRWAKIGVRVDVMEHEATVRSLQILDLAYYGTGLQHDTRNSLGTLSEVVTIDDPGAYTRPFTVTSSHRLLPNDELLEYVCQENEKDTKHLTGSARSP
jgi:hypothetical protein